MAEPKVYYGVDEAKLGGDWTGHTTFSCCGEAEVGPFTKKLISLMKLVMRRQGQHKCFCDIQQLMKGGCICGGN